jgi:glycosyltransferase involved in cell wall biosynthesis
MPSDSEGLPIALLEAMASGLPVVASTVGAIPQVLGDPQAGLLVPPRDTVSLTHALRRLATDPALRSDLSGLSRERAEGYTLERMTDRYERIYRARVRTSAPMTDRRA